MVATARKPEADVPVLSVRDLDKRYGEVEVLQNIDIDMVQGEFLVLVGPSGCGKSTLLNCIAGLEEISAGSITIAGRDVTEVPPRDRDIAMVFQSYALYPTMTVSENIAFGMKVRGVAKPEQKQKIDEVASLLQIEKLLDRKPAHLSGGQRQRVAMGRALVRDPMLFLFDEPLSNLDAKLRVEMRAEIKHLHETTGASIVYVTHDQVEAMTLGSRIVVLKGGDVQQIGTPREIYERPANLFVADFMGSPPMNLIDATIGDVGSKAQIKIGEASFDDPSPPKALSAYAGKAVTVGIRPEALSMVAQADAHLTLGIEMVENAGADTFANLTLNGAKIIARFPGRTQLQVGDTISVKMDLSTLCYFDPATGQIIV